MPDQVNIFDLVHDGVTSSDGGDSTVTKMDPSVSALIALRAATVGWREPGFTGPADASTAIAAFAAGAFPRIPLGAAPGTRPDADFATAITGSWHWNGWQKALAIGMDRIAPLIGTIGDGPSVEEKSSGTVFVAEGSTAGFHDGGAIRSSSVAVVFAPSSTSTATITVAGAGNFRQPTGNGFAVTAANSLRAMPSSDNAPSMVVAGTDAAQPTLGYNYAPAARPSAKQNVVEASFSDAVTASGVFAQLTRPALAKIQTNQPGNVQTSQLGITQAQAAQFKISDIATLYGKSIDLSQPIDGKSDGTQVDGTRSFLSASVSANPTAAATLYLADVVNATPVAGQSVEAFQVGPARGRSGPATTVTDPLHGKVLASAGALNNSLALP
jgi:hypothetical protein